MAKAYVFYNPLAGSGKILEDLEALEVVLEAECVFCDMTKPETYEQALFDMKPEDTLVLCGGDGTLNRFVNLTAGLQRKNEVYYYPAGEHNDFARDFSRRYGNNPFCITQGMKDLPWVQMRNRHESFLTGILFHPSPKIRRTSTGKPRYNISVTACAIVDGTTHRYEKVRFAAVMYGKFCCGGMIPDPGRKRTDGDLSCVMIHSCGKLWANYLLSQLRKGRRVNSQYLTIQRGENIHISFDTPVSILVDGEAQSDIRSFAAGVR